MKLTPTKELLDRIQLKETSLVSSGGLKVDGKSEAFTEFIDLLDNYPFWVNIVTP